MRSSIPSRMGSHMSRSRSFELLRLSRSPPHSSWRDSARRLVHRSRFSFAPRSGSTPRLRTAASMKLVAKALELSSSAPRQRGSRGYQPEPHEEHSHGRKAAVIDRVARERAQIEAESPRHHEPQRQAVTAPGSTTSPHTPRVGHGEPVERTRPPTATASENDIVRALSLRRAGSAARVLVWKAAGVASSVGGQRHSYSGAPRGLAKRRSRGSADRRARSAP